MPTQAERSAESARRLLVAAVELVGEKGFERTTAAEIGERAGYSRARVRTRYGSKDAWLVALRRDELAPRVAPVRDPARTGREQVLAQVDALIALVREDAGMARSFFVLNFETAGPLELLRGPFRDFYDAYEAELAAMLRAGQADGSIGAGLDLGVETRLFVSHGMGLAFRWLLDPAFDLVGEFERWQRWLDARLRPT